MCARKSVECVVGEDEALNHIARLYGSRALEALKEYIPLHCVKPLNEVYLLKAEFLSTIEKIVESGRYPYLAGLYAGRLRSSKPKFIPSHILVDKIYKYIKHPVRAVKISETGVKVVLYGRDILAESVTECYEPVEIGEVLSILGPNGYVYAVGLSTISSCGEVHRLREKDLVAKSVFDLGWYLRGGTILREARYKI